MKFSKYDLVLPLNQADHTFIEALLSRFTIRRKRGQAGVELSVAFDDSTPCTWNRQGREAVRKRIPGFAAQTAYYKSKLDAVLFGRAAERFVHDDPDFPFR